MKCKSSQWKWNQEKEMQNSGLFQCVCCCLFYLFAGDVLEVLARHDASEFGFNKALCPLSLWRPTKD